MVSGLIGWGLVGLYVVVSIGLAAYGFNCYILAYLRSRSPGDQDKPSPPAPDPLPTVTVQLPIYNERYVVERLMKAIAGFDWPRDKLEVQILDDSTDDTVHIASKIAQRYRDEGLDVQHITRESREGAKASALKNGLKQARGDVIAVFDADFVPQPAFLKQTVPHLLADPDIACVQTRWGHVNADYSWFTEAVSVGIDGHFTVEQRVRDEHGLLLNFNGTAGVWRREAIEDAGNWTGQTVAEDLDLSYRVQQEGWEITYLDDVVTEAEVPAQVHAFKRQQARWAKGSLQCARKHLGPTLAHPGFSKTAKAESIFHLTHYLLHPLLLSLILFLPAAMLTMTVPWEITGVFFVATFGPSTMYLVAQRELYPETWWKRAPLVFPLTLIGIGIAVSNTKAALAGLLTDGGAFKRTPKFDLKSIKDRWEDKAYALPMDPTAIGEVGAALVNAVAIAVAMWTGHWWLVPWAALFLLSYGVMAWLSIRHHFHEGPTEAADAQPAA